MAIRMNPTGVQKMKLTMTARVVKKKKCPK